MVGEWDAHQSVLWARAARQGDPHLRGRCASRPFGRRCEWSWTYKYVDLLGFIDLFESVVNMGAHKNPWPAVAA